MKMLITLVFFVVTTGSMAQSVRNDVVIDEIMADPSPVAQLQNGLPEVEFIELKNVSLKPVNLNGWKISDATTTATISAGFMLQPDSFVVIGSLSAASLLAVFGRCIGVNNFPSLDNTGDLLYLTSKEGKLIHAVEYKNSWYGNAVKSNGGWSLEMIDTKNACSGASNWTASTQNLGATPGKKNAADAINPDHGPPALLRAFATDSLDITLVFDEPLDSLSSAPASSFSISDNIAPPLSAVAISPLFNRVTLRLQHPLQVNKVYTVTARNTTDCSGNEIGMINNTRVGLASLVDSLDVVINEILFNPKPDGVDYVEIYNRSNKIIDLKDLYIANRAGSGVVGSLQQLSVSALLLYPQDYLVITENAAIIKQQYAAKNPDAFLELNSLPSFPDDRGTVVLINATGKLVDEVAYSEKWHFKLIENNQGVALERINYNKPSQDEANWHSASTNTGYGTPGYQNSQFMVESTADGAISIVPEIFSPDNDGFNDFTTVTYLFPEPGYVCNITLFDANGRLVRHLMQNALCGLTGYFRWDGLDGKNNKLPIGIYVMITEVFNLSGKTKRFKNGIVIARKLN